MNFSLDDDERMLADAVERFAGRQAAVDARPLGDQDAVEARRWATIAELGLPGLHVPQSCGGLERPASDSFIVMRALGQAGIATPFISTAVVAARLIARGAGESQQQRWLPQMASGNCRVALALLENEFHFTLDHPSTSCQASRISGRKSMVLDTRTADRLLVSVAGEDPHAGLRIACLDISSPGITVTRYPTIDGRICADIAFDKVQVDADDWLEGEPSCPREELLDWALDHGRAALCAEAFGVMLRLLDLTLEHLRSRTQFGQTLGKFQVLQHRAVDMMMLVEQAHSMALVAAAGADDADPASRRRRVSSAKALIGRYGRQVGEYAVHLFGAMGMTDELPAAQCFKRLLAIDQTWGDAGDHTDRAMANGLAAMETM